MRVECDIFLVFTGECRKAIDFYQEVFGIDSKEVNMFTFGELMEDLREEEYRRRIMFAEFSLYGTKILLCDSADFSASYYKKGNNIMLALAISDKAEMERIFHRLAEEGTVLFGPTPTEVIEELGIVTDKFGVTWQINLSPKGPKEAD